MHDWWIALCAAVFGRIGYIDTSTVLYRQHSNNEVGAKAFINLINPSFENIMERWKTGQEHFNATLKQARKLFDRMENHNHKLHTDMCKLINRYAYCDLMKRKQRAKMFFFSEIKRQGIVQQVGLLLRLMMMKEKKSETHSEKK
jgi:hypothetical protein